MKAKFNYYHFHDHPNLESNPKTAIALFKNYFAEADENRIELFHDKSGIAVYENEIDLPIQIKNSSEYEFTLEETIKQGYLAGKRHFERYSYFELEVSKYEGNGKHIIISLDLNSGEKFNESVLKNEVWNSYELYVSHIVCGIKQKCMELQIADLNFKIIDLEYNLLTSNRTSQYAVKHFIDMYVAPKLVYKANT